jgi:hypothetical protein
MNGLDAICPLQRLFPSPRYGELVTEFEDSQLIDLVSKRTFLRGSTENKTLRIYAIGLSLYEPLEGTTAEQIGHEVIRTQWM